MAMRDKVEGATLIVDRGVTSSRISLMFQHKDPHFNNVRVT
jgi:hypothetical protein